MSSASRTAPILDARRLAASDRADDGVDADVEAGADDRTAVLLRHAGTAGEEHRRGVGLEGGDDVGAGDLDRLGRGEERGDDPAVLDQGDPGGTARAILDENGVGLRRGEEAARERGPVVGMGGIGELGAEAEGGEAPAEDSAGGNAMLTEIGVSHRRAVVTIGVGRSAQAS